MGGFGVCDYTSCEAVRALCDAFVQRAEPEDISPVPDMFVGHKAHPSRNRQTPRHGVPRQEPQPTFASLAVAFITGLVSDSTKDLRTDWLLHRLHSILVAQQPLRPGEIEVLRADISARVEISSLSKMEKRLLTNGVEKILISLKPRPLPAARLSPTNAGYAKR